MTDIKWGLAIAVDGKRPGWLVQADTKRMLIVFPGGYERFPTANCDPLDQWDWSALDAIRLPADHPHYRQSTSIDWSKSSEAVHEDGRVVAVTLAPDEHGYGGTVPRVTNECPAEDTNNNWYEDGSDFCRDGKWRIRNVPQPTPQADTKPDLRAAAVGVVNSARNGIGQSLSDEEVVDQIAVTLGLASQGSDLTARMEALVRRAAKAGPDADYPERLAIATEACVIEGMLPEPADPDLIEARELAADWAASFSHEWEKPIRDGEKDADPHSGVSLARAALARGRALALAGEKEA